MSKYDTPGMDGIGGMIRQDIEDAEKSRKAFEKRFGSNHKPPKTSTIRKAAYNLANEFDSGLKNLFGL